MSKLAKYLNERLVGNVFSRASILNEYSTSKSLFMIEPRLVAFPENTNDVSKLLKFSNQLAEQGHLLPIVVRGNNHNSTGATLGEGLILSTTKLNQLIELDLRGYAVHVQAGMALGTLNQILKEHGMWLPVIADPTMTLGGLIADARIDDAMSRLGGIQNYVVRAEVVLSNGEVVQFGPTRRHIAKQKGTKDTLEGEIYRKFPEEKRTDLLSLFYGSEGTLGVITELVLNVSVLPAETEQVLIVAKDKKTAFRLMQELSKTDPLKLKVYDRQIMEVAFENGKRLSWLGRSAWIIHLTMAGNRWHNQRQLRQVLRIISGEKYIIDKTENFELVKEVDAAVTSFMYDGLGGHERVPILENVYIPNESMAKFSKLLANFEEKEQIRVPFDGDFLGQIYNLRPAIDVRSRDRLENAILLTRKLVGIISEVGGTIYADGASGLWRGLIMTPKSAKKSQAEQKSEKQIFDPNNILNPDIKSGFDYSEAKAKLSPRWPQGLR